MGPTALFKSATKLPEEVDPRFKNLFNLKMVDDFVSLSQAEEELQKRIVYTHMKSGVHFLNPKSVLLDVGCKIGKNVEIGPCNVLKGKTEIKDNVVLRLNNLIENSEIGEGGELINCVIRNSKIGKNSVIKPNSVIENGKLKGEEK
jgi:bifunctional N-acetylglucosamine-1-phosphate-uridyltransferase/glucosamine-1-phosphate-acetyltransferase GlmU-like protein